MAAAQLGTETGILIPSVGELFWTHKSTTTYGETAPKYEDTTFEEWCEGNEQLEREGKLRHIFNYGLPNEQGFDLTLLFPQDLSEVGFGCYMRECDLLLGEDDDTQGYLIDEERPFPHWLIRFARDMQDWTRAEQLVMSYDRTTDGENVDLLDYPLNAAFITLNYGFSHLPSLPAEYAPVPIKNPDLFIGSAATHLALLRADYAV